MGCAGMGWGGLHRGGVGCAGVEWSGLRYNFF